MPVLTLDTNYISGSYAQQLMQLLMQEENAVLANPSASQADIADALRPQYDGGASIAIGYGIDLLNNSVDTINRWLSSVNLTLSKTDIALISGAKANPKPANLESIARQMQLTLPSETAAETVLASAIADKEVGLTQLLSNNGISLGDSCERIALMSLFYNSNSGTANPLSAGSNNQVNNLIGPNLLSALQLGNRADAWYEIRYGTNKNALSASAPSDAQGIANRRYFEADLFGLYDPGPVSLPEAIQVYQMYTKNAATMIQYDERYGGGRADTAAELDAAADVLVAQYGQGNQFDALDIYVAPQPTSPSTPIVGGSINRAADTAGDLIIGSFGNDTLIGSAAGSNVLVAGNGDDRLYAGKGNDTLVAGGGRDLLDGGAGYDSYLITTNPVTTGALQIRDSDGQGAIIVNGSMLSGPGDAPATQVGDATLWVNGNVAYKFTSTSMRGDIGTLQITLPGETITIDDFNLSQAQTNKIDGFLGLQFSEKIKLKVGGDVLTSGAIASQSDSAVDPLPGVQTLTAYVSAVDDSAQTVTLTMTQGDASGFAIDTGNGHLVHFDSGGSVTLTVDPGDDSVTFGLVNTSDVAQAEAIKLTATIGDPSSANGTSSSTLEVDYEPTPGFSSGVTPDRIVIGDLAPTTDPVTLDSLGNVITDPATPSPNRDDTLYGSSGNDSIDAGGGANDVDATQGGNDTIRAGVGNDTIVAADGNNLITGGGGQDLILAGDGANRIYVDGEIDLTAAIIEANAALGSGEKGSFVGVGSGDNTIVGGSGNDLMMLGGGNDMVVLGPGNATVVGGAAANVVWPDWSTTLTVTTDSSGTHYSDVLSAVDYASSAGYTPSAELQQLQAAGYQQFNVDPSGNPDGAGSETIFGGSGNYYITGSNGGNYIDVGSGASVVFSGGGDDTIFAGTGNSHISAQGGDDYVEAETGDDSIFGGAGNNTLFGGSGHDTIVAGVGGQDWAKVDAGDNYVEAGTGDTFILGGGGHDTLIAGAGSDTIKAGDNGAEIFGGSGNSNLLGGAGDDYIESDSGNDTIAGGGGNDTIYGGSGNDLIYAAGSGGDSDPWASSGGGGSRYIEAGDGNTRIYGSGGTDTIVAGSGDDTIYAGDGNEYLYGGEGWDTIYGGGGTNHFEGGVGSDVMVGGAGTNVFVAGAGESTMYGGSGSNTYVLNAGFGDVTIANVGASDTLQFGAGTALADLTVSATIAADGAPSLFIEDDAGGSVTIENGLDGALQVFAFADGTSLIFDQLIAQAYTVPIDAAGASGDLIFSTDANDSLVGSGGNDTIYAWGANTTLVGGGGSTNYVVHDASDVVVAQPGENSTVTSSVSYVAPANINTLTLSGNTDLTATGNDLSNVITANTGNDTLIAGSGVATLVGGAGNDTFVVNNSEDVVVAQAGQNQNAVFSSVSYVQPENVGTLMLTGAGIAATGNDQGGALIAQGANDTLIASAGVVTMQGGGQNDTFVVNNADDVVLEQPNAGSNTVVSSVSYVLPDNIQNLTLTGDADLTATGNNLRGVIRANDGNDTLIAGSGNETLIGGAGQDTFVFGLHMGAETVIDDSSAGAVVQLASGLDFSEIDAAQQGNDLLLRLAGTHSSMLLKDYFSNPQSWTLQGALDGTSSGQGGVVTGQALLDATAARQSAPLLSRLEQEFIAQAEVEIATQYSDEGYTNQGGTWVATYAPGSSDALGHARYYDTQTTRQWTTSQWSTLSDGSVGVVSSNSGTNTSETTSWQTDYNPSPFVVASQNTVSLPQEQVTASDPVIYADGGSSSTTIQLVGYNVRWVVDSSYTQNSSWSDAGTWSGPAGSNWWVEYSDFYTQVATTSYLSAHFDGALTAAMTAYPGDLNPYVPYPSVLPGEFDQTQITEPIELLTVAGAGDHTVYGGSHTFVDSEEGNNHIYGAEYAYAGSGNDTMVGGGTLVGGTGNNLMVGGETMIAGSGNDTLIGSEVGSTFDIDPGVVGVDVIDALDPTYGEGWGTGVPWAGLRANDFAALAPYYADGSLPCNTVRFEEGVSLSDVTLSWGYVSTSWEGGTNSLYTTLNLNWGNHQGLQIVIPHSDDDVGSGYQLQFADGTTLSLADLIASAPPAPSFDPQQQPVAVGLLEGGAGPDLLIGGYGNDTFVGGAGGDFMLGGVGQNTYVFNLGDGQDTIDNSANTLAGMSTGDVIQFGAGISSADVRIDLHGNDLLVQYGSGSDSVLIKGFDLSGQQGSAPIGTFQFADGSSTSYTSDGQGGHMFTTYDAQGNVLAEQTWWNNGSDRGVDNYDATTGEHWGSGTYAPADGGYSYVYDQANLADGGTEYKETDTYLDGTIDVYDGIQYADGGSHSVDATTHADGSTELIVDDRGADGGYVRSDTVTAADGSIEKDVIAVVNNGDGTYLYTETQTHADGSRESYVETDYADGTYDFTDTVTSPDGSYQRSWGKADGSHGDTNYVASTGETYGDVAQAGAGYSYTFDNTNLGNGVTESKVTYTYDNGSTYSTDMVKDSDGSYQQAWSKSDGSHGDTNYVASTGETSGDVAQAGAGYSYTFDNTNLGNGATESKITYTYTNGSTYSTDTVKQSDGSYQQAWTKSDGSHGDTNYVASTGETSGDVAQAGAGYSYTFDNTNLGNGVTESKVTYTYDNGSTYSTDTVKDPDGSYQQAWSKSDGSHGDTNYVASTGETYGDVAQAGASYSYTYDNTNLGNGVNESKITYSYTNGSTYSTDTVKEADGSYQQAWSKSDGSHGDTNYVASTGETYGDVAQAGASYSYAYDNLNLGNGVTESKITYTYTNGSTYSTDTVKDPDGSYQQAWSKSDGSHGDTNYVASTGETYGDVAQAGASYSYTYDNTKLVDGVNAGATESKITYTYGNGSTYSTDTVKQSDGSYQQAWSKSDGSHGHTNYVALTGETYGDVAQAGAGYSYTFDNTKLVDGVNAGATESKVTYTYANGSTYATDTVKNPDGSYQQSWTKSDGTAGSTSVAGGVVIARSWLNADGTQGVSAGGNQLLLGAAANDSLSAGAGNQLLMGGRGNDTLATGAGVDIVAFDQGDGRDLIRAGSGQSDVLSLGGNFAYSDLALQKNGNDLVLAMGSADSLTFKDWYASSANQEIVTLQVINQAMSDFAPGSSDALRNSNVETFDFRQLVGAFNQARAADPSLSAWSLTDALLDAHLSSSDSAALGGDLAYQYGMNGNLSGFGVAAAESTVSDSQFASAPQTLHPWSTLNTGTAKIA